MAKHVCEEESSKGNFIFGVNLRCLIIASSLHFLLSAFVGLSVFLLTSTILSSTKGGEIPSYYINLFSLVASLPFASLAHILEDYWWNRF